MLLFLILNFSALADSANETLVRECYELNRGRSCVSLGTTLWQQPTQRAEALRAFEKACALKVESGCELKKLRTPPSPKESAKIQGIAHISTDLYTVERAVAIRYSQDLGQIVSTAEMASEKNSEGLVNGYRFVAIDRTSVLRALGFNVGDILTHINGEPVSMSSMALVPLVAYIEAYTVQLRRAGVQRTVTYKLVD